MNTSVNHMNTFIMPNMQSKNRTEITNAN